MYLQARALLFALVVVALTSSMMYVALTKVLSAMDQQLGQSEAYDARRAVDSGISYMLAYSVAKVYDGSPPPTRFRNILGSVNMVSHPYGLFDGVSSKASTNYLRDTFIKSIILGRNYATDTLLTVENRGKAFDFVSEISLIDQHTSIESTSNNELQFINIFELPVIDMSRINSVFALLQGGESAINKVFPNSDAIVTGTDLVLNNSTGKVREVYIATQSIIVEANTRLYNCVVIAPDIKINRDVIGSVQIYASRSLYLADNIYLEAPSTIIAGAECASLNVGVRDTIEGTVVHFAKRPDATELNVPSTSVIKGIVYTPGLILLDGTIYGTTYAGLIKCTINYEVVTNSVRLSSLKRYDLTTAPALFPKHHNNSPIGRLK